MVSIVKIAPVSNEITLDEKGEGVLVFTVTSTLDAAMQVGAKVIVENPEEEEWVRIEGDQERVVKAKETDQFTVSVRAPKGTAPGKHKISLLIYQVDQPGEEYTQGPDVSFEIPAGQGGSEIPEKKKPFPVWIVIVGVVAFLAIVGGIVAWIIISPNGEEPEPTVEVIRVPDLSGLTLEAATAKLTGAGLAIGEVSKQPAADKTMGTVIAQDPPAGGDVNASTGIMITLADLDPDHRKKFCEQFAQEGLRQHEQNRDKSCGLTGAHWSSDFGYHYSKCENASDYQALSARLNQERQNQLDACLQAAQDKSTFCAQYAKTADEQQKKNSAERCGLSGARWSTNLEGHRGWCLSLGDDYQQRATSEEQARSNSLTQCAQKKYERKKEYCETYAETAKKQHQRNVDKACGFKGARWQSNHDNHYKWCMHGANYTAHAPGETRARSEELKRCAKCETYAKTAKKQQAENVRKSCGFRGNRWQSNYDNHFNWCMHGNNYKDHAPSETRARQSDLKRCASKKTTRAPCEMYQHADFRGWRYLVKANSKDEFVGKEYNDQVSAVRVPTGCRLTVYQHSKFKGKSKNFGPGSHRYIGGSWNDQISSASCSCR
jgi:hypothetical protein